SDDVAKVGAEYTNVKAAAISQTHDGLGIKCVGRTDTRSKSLVSIIDIAVQADRALTRDADYALIQVGEAAFVLPIDALREINFPTESIGQSEFGAGAPGILGVEEKPLLAFRGVQAGADETLERCDVTQQESSESQSTSASVGSEARIKE